MQEARMPGFRSLRRSAIVYTVTTVATSALAGTPEDYQVVKAFGIPDATQPTTGLLLATDGHFYGGTASSFFGGPPSTIYRVTPGGVYTDLATIPDQGLAGDLIQGSDGHLYGVTDKHFVRVTLEGAVSVLRVLPEFSGGVFRGGLAEGDDGNFYGLTWLGGEFAAGIALRITPGGALTTLRSMTDDEATSNRSLMKASDGFFYGHIGGRGGDRLGRLFRMAPDGTTTVLHEFTGGAGGAYPSGGLVEASDGNLYGTTVLGGTHDRGTVYRLSREGAFSVVHTFDTSESDVSRPMRRMIQGSDGALYGTTSSGVFRLTLDSRFRFLHSSARAYPGWAGGDRYGWTASAVTEGADGNLYGTMWEKGPGTLGVIFRLNRARAPCTTLVDLAGGAPTLYLRGALKSETPAFTTAWLVTAEGARPLWFRFSPAIDPTFSYELALALTSTGTVGVFAVVVTSKAEVCADWTTLDVGGTGASAADLERLLERSGLPPNWLGREPDGRPTGEDAR
jgi:uncharacterized repeat protein (TIGR03803 family)